MYIVVAILAFGILIAVHEIGHFTAAKLLGVRVNEFSIGMGPAFFKLTRGETQYSLRLLPLGGYCAMEGEDEESNDPRSFSSKSILRRFIILAAGSFMNFLAGFIVVLILMSQAAGFRTLTITDFIEGSPYQGEDALMAGDTIVEIDGSWVLTRGDFETYLGRGDGVYDIVVKRDGERVKLKDFTFVPVELEVDGETALMYGLSFGEVIETTPLVTLKYSFYDTVNFVRLVWIGLTDLISGGVGLNDLSGVVGIVSMINDVGQETQASAGIAAAASNIAYLCAFIAVNLAVMNMLPLPALDGGRIFFMIVTAIIERVSRRKLDPKYEGYVHTAGLVLLLGLMAVVMFNDIVKIFRS